MANQNPYQFGNGRLIGGVWHNSGTQGVDDKEQARRQAWQTGINNASKLMNVRALRGANADEMAGMAVGSLLGGLLGNWINKDGGAPMTGDNGAAMPSSAGTVDFSFDAENPLLTGVGYMPDKDKYMLGLLG